IDGAAAGFLAVRIIANQAEGECIVRLEQQLPADEEAVAVVDVAFRAARRIHHIVETVAPRIHSVEAEGDLLAERSRDTDLAADLVGVTGPLSEQIAFRLD